MIHVKNLITRKLVCYSRFFLLLVLLLASGVSVYTTVSAGEVYPYGASSYGLGVYGGGIAPDTEPPSVPASVEATALEETRVQLLWASSTDNRSVVGYEVERCVTDACADFVPVSTSTLAIFYDDMVEPATTYQYRIRAFDAAYNYSSFSATVSVTLPSLTVPEITLVVTPESVVAGESATLSWSSVQATSCVGDGFDSAGSVTGIQTVSPTQSSTYTLVCVGPGGSATASATLDVVPTLAVSANATPLEGVAPLAVSFASAASGGTGFYSYEWDFGDGTSATVPVTSHVYATSGSYRVVLTVQSETQVHTSSFSIEVNPAPTGPKNLLVNSSFETLGDWQGGFFTKSKGLVTRTALDKYTGTHSVIIDGDTNTSSGQLYGVGPNQLPVTQGQEYLFKAWYKGSNAYLVLKWFNSDGIEIKTAQHTKSLENAPEWQEGETRATPPVGAVRVWVFVQTRKTAAPVFFDDLFFGY